MDEFAKRLKYERERNEFSQKQMADLLNIPVRAYQNYEALGVNQCDPRLKTLIQISKILDVSIDYLVGNDII